MNIAELNNHSVEQLRELAGKLGLHVHHRAGKETVLKSILDSMQPQQPIKHEAETPKPAETLVANTPEQVEAAIAKIKENRPEFTSTYPDDGTWVFKYKGAEESGNLAIPLRVIVQKAQNVSKGAIRLMAKNQYFGEMPTAGNSAYTNIVL